MNFSISGQDLYSALAAEVITARVGAKYGLRAVVIAILHTFNGKLEHNSHVHTLVTGGGLDGSFRGKRMRWSGACRRSQLDSSDAYLEYSYTPADTTPRENTTFLVFAFKPTSKQPFKPGNILHT